MTKKEIIERYGEEEYQRCLERRKQYNQQHREERNQYNKQYREQHREERNQYNKQYQKQYKKQHREENKQYQRQWSRKHINMFVYCIPEQIEQVENYQFAKKVNFNGWNIHHRLETHTSDGERRLVDLTREELKALDMYYNRPANELIFLTASEHMKLHRNSPK